LLQFVSYFNAMFHVEHSAIKVEELYTSFYQLHQLIEVNLKDSGADM
jgi:hypothetical protein